MKNRYSCIRGVAVVFLAAASTIAVFAQETKTKSDLSRSFKKFDLVRLDAANAEAAGTSQKKIKIHADGRDFELAIAPNDVRSERYFAEDTQTLGTLPAEAVTANTYKGKISGDPSSEVRVTLDGSKVTGFFQSGSQRYFIEPARKYSKTAS